jgi:hypothetical protein
MIIMGIMVAIIIILFFILFPFIPLIMAVIGAITVVVTGATLGEAARLKSGFCFSEGSHVIIKNAKGDDIPVPVEYIKIGDTLGHNCGKVTAIIQMSGADVDLYELNGIHVSGSHTVLSESNEWILVGEDKRAIVTDKRSSVLYCFNTESHCIPIEGANGHTIFRDWEELDDDDVRGQYEWNYNVMKILNEGVDYNKWRDQVSSANQEIPLLSPDYLIKTPDGSIKVHEIKLGDSVYDSKGLPTRILGIITGIIEGKTGGCGWHTGMIEFENGVWKRGVSNLYKSTVANSELYGHTLITESGDFVIIGLKGKESIVRDFTDVGYQTIHKTYPFVAERLRLYKKFI